MFKKLITKKAQKLGMKTTEELKDFVELKKEDKIGLLTIAANYSQIFPKLNKIAEALPKNYKTAYLLKMDVKNIITSPMIEKDIVLLVFSKLFPDIWENQMKGKMEVGKALQFIMNMVQSYAPQNGQVKVPEIKDDTPAPETKMEVLKGEEEHEQKK